MKKLVFLATYLMSLSVHAQTYLNCDFSHGIPSDFSLYDIDRNIPSPDVEDLGFRVGKPWITVKLSNENGNVVACSTSWYATPGKSDDWMVTSPVHISSKDAVLSWEARAADPDFRDGYSVYISTTGATPECFDISQPVYTTKEEEGKWMKRSVKLSEYVGKTIYVAFVNNSQDCSRLYLDRIYAGIPAAAYLLCDLPDVTGLSGDITVSGSVYTDSSTTVTGCRIGLTVDGQTSWEDFPDMVIQPGEDIPFTLQTKLNIGVNSQKDYSLSIECDGTSFTRDYSLTSLTSRPLCEEFTGMWCPYCVKGIYMSDKMKEKYPDTFINVAIHEDDALTIKDAPSSVSYGASGLPWHVYNRSKSFRGDPDIMEANYNYALEQPVIAGIDLTADLDGENNIHVISSIRFADTYEEASFRLQYLVTENNVYRNGYYQENAYSGMDISMGGWEKLGDPVTDVRFQDVLRHIEGPDIGIDGSVPQSFNAMEPIEHNWTFPMPSNVMNKDETEIIVLLLTDDGTIANAAKTSLSKDNNGINELSSYGLDVRISNRIIQVDFPSSVHMRLFDISGKSVSESSGNYMSVENISSGMYILTITRHDGQNICTKIII